MRIGVVNNLIAGKSQQQVGRMLDFLRSHPDVLHVETDDVGVMPEALADLARQEVDLLVVNGGDGTLQYMLTEILGGGAFGDRVPMIAPLRAGRTNMTALDLGARRNALDGLSKLIQACHEGRGRSLAGSARRVGHARARLHQSKCRPRRTTHELWLHRGWRALGA